MSDPRNVETQGVGPRAGVASPQSASTASKRSEVMAGISRVFLARWGEVWVRPHFSPADGPST